MADEQNNDEPITHGIAPGIPPRPLDDRAREEIEKLRSARGDVLQPLSATPEQRDDHNGRIVTSRPFDTLATMDATRARETKMTAADKTRMDKLVKLFKGIDIDNNSVITADEIPLALKENIFKSLDLDRNNQVSKRELELVQDALGKHGLQITLASEITAPLNTGKKEKELFISNPPPGAPNPSSRGR